MAGQKPSCLKLSPPLVSNIAKMIYTFFFGRRDECRSWMTPYGHGGPRTGRKGRRGNTVKLKAGWSVTIRCGPGDQGNIQPDATSKVAD